MNLKVGDLFYTNAEGKYYVYKLLRIDPITNIHHVIVYKPFDKVPNTININNLSVYATHIPIDSPKEYKVMVNQAVTEQDLLGFYDYLKLTDFARYLEETGRTLEEVVNKANNFVKQADDAYKREDYKEAIIQYTNAIEEFPLFFEAVDRRAFCRMAMGDFLDAIKDFEFSLLINPNSVTAEFAIGECYYKLKDFQKAVDQFEHTLTLYPDDDLTAEWLEISRRKLAQNK